MSHERTTGRREGWVGTVLWALLVVASISLMSIGLLRACFSASHRSRPSVEDARVGGLFIFAGAVSSLGAAVWSAFRGDPRWVTAFVAAPAVLVGGIALFAPYSLLRHFAAVAAFPLALAGLFGGLPGNPRGQVRATASPVRAYAWEQVTHSRLGARTRGAQERTRPGLQGRRRRPREESCSPVAADPSMPFILSPEQGDDGPEDQDE